MADRPDAGAVKGQVSCVSLGSWCGLACCLRKLGLRQAAYPFDWNRTTLPAVIGFIQTRFSGFFDFVEVVDHAIPLGDAEPHGDLVYRGRQHSIWHEDVRKPEERQKYERRIERFYNNPAERILFMRAANSHDELEYAPALMDALDEQFPHKQVFLLMIIDFQDDASRNLVRGYDDRLLVFCNSIDLARYTGAPVGPYDKYVQAYEEPILWAVEYVASFPDVSRWRMRCSLSSLVNSSTAYACGAPQLVPWRIDIDELLLNGEGEEEVECGQCSFQ